MSGLAEFGAGAAHDLDRRLEARLAGHADCPAGHGINGDVPEAGAGCRDSGREILECAAVVRMTATIFKTAEVCIAHQANVARLGALDDDDVVFVEVLALVNELHVGSKKGAFAKKISTIARALVQAWV